MNDVTILPLLSLYDFVAWTGQFIFNFYIAGGCAVRPDILGLVSVDSSFVHPNVLPANYTARNFVIVSSNIAFLGRIQLDVA